MDVTKTNTPLQAASQFPTGTGPISFLVKTWVSASGLSAAGAAALASAGTVGTIKGQIQALFQGATAYVEIVVRIIAPDGTTVRGTLIGPTHITSSAPNTVTLTNHPFPQTATPSVGTALTAVASAAAGDYIVAEIGFYMPSGTASPTAQIRNGDVSAQSDLGTDNTDQSTTLDPWLEFSATLFTTTTFIPKTSMWVA